VRFISFLKSHFLEAVVADEVGAAVLQVGRVDLRHFVVEELLDRAFVRSG